MEKDRKLDFYIPPNVNQQVWLAAVAQVNKQILLMLLILIGGSIMFAISLVIFLLIHWIAGLILMFFSVFLLTCTVIVRKNMGLQSCCMKIAGFNPQERFALNQFEYER